MKKKCVLNIKQIKLSGFKFKKDKWYEKENKD